MTDYIWYCSDDEEGFFICCGNSKEEAIKKAKEEYEKGTTIFIFQARLNSVLLSSKIDIEDILETIEDNMCDGERSPFCSDKLFFNINKEQLDSLKETIKKSIDEWQEKHSLIFEEEVFTDIKEQFSMVV
ncbi:hypothetical protein HK18_08020 [Commensalibacter intestini]|uniref:Uncharacterized protein n=1 Tax=Commensalibacter intestini TaxID=479936 RepID=A0A251ZUW5_9PROT|nr:hypothetical protein [Commensalibacter intestini]OUI78461.1 hypothetical protein HK18_08020 [Commensalibacter intestini]